MAGVDLLTRPTVRLCRHEPPCPAADAIDHGAARVVQEHHQQGWSLLCNGVIVFDDTGELLPDGTAVAPRRGPALHVLAARQRELAMPGGARDPTRTESGSPSAALKSTAERLGSRCPAVRAAYVCGVGH